MRRRAGRTTLGAPHDWTLAAASVVENCYDLCGHSDFDRPRERVRKKGGDRASWRMHLSEPPTNRDDDDGQLGGSIIVLFAEFPSWPNS